MSTLRQIIADIRGTNRLLSADGQINDRVIARELKTASLMLIKQATDKRKLWSSPNLFTPLPCFKMETVALAECCDYTSPRKISKSVLPIPKIAEGLFGLVIQSVNSIERTQKNYKESTPERYGNILRMNLTTSDTYYWILNNHLYVTNPDLEAVSIAAFFEDDVPNNLLYPSDCNCKPSLNIKNKCHSPLDEPFRCPGYMETSVKDMVNKKLLETYFRISQDNSNNGEDNQTKTT